MQLTRRAFILLLLGALPLAATTVWPPALSVAAGYFGLLVVLLAADWLTSARPRDFQLRREGDARLSLNADNPIHLHLDNYARHPVNVAVRDEFPVGFQADLWQLSGRALPQESTVLTYHLKPLHRGDYQFGDLNLRYRSRLGLLVRQQRYQAAAPVKVYPNLQEMHRYELLARRGMLQEAGLRNIRLLGRGTEFERLRDYQADDDYRRINWKATARRGRPVSIDYETERSQNLLIMLDTGRLMAAPTGPLAKLDYAINTALMLAFVATRMGDNAGLLAFADRVDGFIPPRRGRRQFLNMVEALYRMPVHLTEPDYGQAFRYLTTHHRKRSLIVLFTDLVDPDASRLLVSHLAALYPHHLPLCVTISDPGITRLAATPPVDTHSTYEKAVAEDLLEQRRGALEMLRHRGVFTLDVPAEQLTAGVVNRYLELKARTRL